MERKKVGAVPCGLLAQSYHSRLFMFSIPYGGVSRGSRRSPAAGPCKRPPCSTTRSPVASALGYALSMLSETLRDRKLISLGRSFLAESDLISGAAARQPCLFGRTRRPGRCWLGLHYAILCLRDLNALWRRAPSRVTVYESPGRSQAPPPAACQSQAERKLEFPRFQHAGLEIDLYTLRFTFIFPMVSFFADGLIYGGDEVSILVVQTTGWALFIQPRGGLPSDGPFSSLA